MTKSKRSSTKNERAKSTEINEKNGKTNGKKSGKSRKKDGKSGKKKSKKNDKRGGKQSSQKNSSTSGKKSTRSRKKKGKKKSERNNKRSGKQSSQKNSRTSGKKSTKSRKKSGKTDGSKRGKKKSKKNGKQGGKLSSQKDSRTSGQASGKSRRKSGKKSDKTSNRKRVQKSDRKTGRKNSKKSSKKSSDMSTATKTGTAIVWFRQDLRLADNPALHAACEACERVVPVFIDDPRESTAARIGSASRVWLHHSLASLDAALESLGSRLICRQGDPLEVLEALAAECGATRVFWNRCQDPVTIARDTNIKESLAALEPKTFNALLVFEPWSVLKKDGTPYRVYTPYWRAAAAAFDEDRDRHEPLPAPDSVPGDDASLQLAGAGDIEGLALLPAKSWPESMMSHWSVGEVAASRQLDNFLEAGVQSYSEGRDLPGKAGTSRMSPHLHHGEISPRQILARLSKGRALSSLGDDETVYAKEVFWREFGYSLLYHFPDMPSKPLDRRFSAFAWKRNKRALQAWQEGRTGVPIVDAGMRELYATGWMHNRVRMIAASYLVKNLLLHWREGEAWFRDCLVDADVASNSMGWQWVAGCGADAAPFFRVFNPVLQGERFDGEGDYVRSWVPELSEVDKRKIHQPWSLPAAERDALDYPEPLVDLKASRQQALDAFAEIRG